MAQLVDRSLPTPDVRGSNPVIGKMFSVKGIEKTKKKKKGQEWPFLKKTQPEAGLK